MKSPGSARAFSLGTAYRLLERVADGRKGGVELGSHALRDHDDRNRNTGGDQPIFDGGGSGLVFQETSERFHVGPPGTRFPFLLDAKSRRTELHRG